MAVVTFDIELLARLGLPKDKLEKAIDGLGMSLEKMEGGKAMIDITPNRPDLLGAVGFARAASFFLGKRTPKEKEYHAEKGKANPQINVMPSVKGIRPFIAAMAVTKANLRGEALREFINFTEKLCDTYGRKRRKVAIGLYDLSKVGFPLAYGAISEGKMVPLGSHTKSSFSDILKNHQKGIEYSHIIGGKMFPFLEDSSGNVMSLIPIINSELSKVADPATDLLVELTGTSQNAVESALNMLACAFIDMGADVQQCDIVYGKKRKTTPILEYRTIKFSTLAVEKTLGARMDSGRIIGLANRMGYVAAKYGAGVMCYVPPYRLDVLNEQDVIEDIAIAFGYENIVPQPIPSISTGMPEDERLVESSISKLMIGLGFTEAVNYYLTNQQMNFASMGIKEDKNSTVEVSDSKTESITMLRTNLLHGLMQNLGASTHEKMPQMLFEIGKVFTLSNGKPVESSDLALVSEHAKANFSEMKSVVQSLLALWGIRNFRLEEYSGEPYIKGRAARIVVGKDELGEFGEVDPRILINFKIEEPVVAAEIKLPGKYFSE